MSSISNDLSILLLLGKIRRQMNVRATQALRPLGIGPKQGILIRKLGELKSATPSELANLTLTDLAATGKIIESLEKKGWVAKSDHPKDRRQWLISLTAEGSKVALRLAKIYGSLSFQMCEPLSSQEKKSLLGQLSKISTHLGTKGKS